jgi:hypothetical protein
MILGEIGMEMPTIVKLQEFRGEYHICVPLPIANWQKWEKGREFVVEKGKDGIVYRDLATVVKEEREKEERRQ